MNSPRETLTAEQKQAFIDDGFLKVSGLVPADVITRTRDEVLKYVDADLRDPRTWVGKPGVFEDPLGVTVPCRTVAIEEVARELVGDTFTPGARLLSPFKAASGQDGWTEGYIPVLRYPTDEVPRDWEPPAPPADGYHLDGIDFVTLMPTLTLLVVFIYLTDVEPYGGATVVVPGSHRQIFEHYRANGADQITDKPPALPYRKPLPVAGKAGDVILMHYLLAHTASPNRDVIIRVGLNAGIQRHEDGAFPHRTGAPEADWTPLDYTLRVDTLR